MNEQKNEIPDIVPGTTVEQPYVDFLRSKHEREVEEARSGVESALAIAATSETASLETASDTIADDQKQETVSIDHASYVRQLGEGIQMLRQYRRAEQNQEEQNAA